MWLIFIVRFERLTEPHLTPPNTSFFPGHAASILRNQRIAAACYRRGSQNQSISGSFVRSHLPILRGTDIEFALEAPNFVDKALECAAKLPSGLQI